MALKCECNRLFEIKQSEVNCKGDIVIRCNVCGRAYFIDLIPIENLMEVISNTTKIKIINK